MGMINRFLSLGCLAILILGCDDRPAGPAADSKAAANKTTGPATQELLHASRKSLPLGYIPFKLNVPPGWRVHAPGNSTMAFLQGLTPSGGEVQIQLSQRPARSAEQIQYLVDGAKKEKARNPDSVKVAELRTQGDLTILVRQSIGKPITLPGSDVGIDTSPEYRWTINIFVPRGKDSAQYELNFLGLTQNRFNADKDFLISILDTLEVDSSTRIFE